MAKIRVLLAEDHVVLRDGLKSLLADELDVEVVAEAGNGQETCHKALQLNPDVIVMDLSLPELNGIDATARILQACPDTQVVILSMYDNEEYVFQALRAGAAAYVLKQSDSGELLAAIRAAYSGGSFLSPSISRTIIDEYIRRAEAKGRGREFDILTVREREVLQLVVTGTPNREIAGKLGVSVKTVESHCANMLKKLGLRNKIELITCALDKGWVIQPAATPLQTSPPTLPQK